MFLDLGLFYCELILVVGHERVDGGRFESRAL